MQTSCRQTYLSSLFFSTIILLTFTTCQKNTGDLKTIPNIIIENHKIQDQQDISNFFTSKTITVTGEDAIKIPSKVRSFDFFQKTLFLVSRYPSGTITAINEEGKVKWQLSASTDPLTTFTSIWTFHLDRENKKIRVIDDKKERIYSYSLEGDFLGRENIPKSYPNDVYLQQDGSYLLSITAYKNNFEFKEKEKKAALVVFNKDNRSINPDNILLNHYYYNPKHIPFVDFNDFFESGTAELFYHRNFGDTIFQVKNLRVTPVTTFSFAKNDLRKKVLSDPNINVIVQKFFDENIPRSHFVIPVSNYFLASYDYNEKEIFTMINLETNKTLINTNNYICDGKYFTGRLDYEGGLLLNQMYAGNYNQLQTDKDKEVNTGSSKYEEGSFVYTILSPKW